MSVVIRDVLNEVSVLSLRCFVAVVQTHSFSSAARQLRVSPSAITKHVQRLETAVNVALFHRTTRRISVTEAGERFYTQCLGILAQIDSLAATMVSERELSGHLRVTAPPSYAATLLGPNLHRFLEEHPGMSLDVVVSSATPDLIRDRIDVAIALQERPETKLTHILLAASPRAICASPAYVERRGVPRTPDELHDHACLSARFSELAEPWTLRQDGEWRTINVRSRLFSDSGDLLRKACLMGAGLGNFYAFHVQEDIAGGRLVQVLADYESKPKNIYAVIPHRQLVRPQTEAFIEFARSLSSPA